MRIFMSLILAFFLSFSVSNMAFAAPIKEGSFAGVNGKKVNGSVVIEKKDGKTVLTLSGDFKSSRGPSLFVYLGNGSDIGVQLSKLKKRKGSQSYVVPKSVKLSSFSKVFIYCKPFKVVFGQAKLK